MANVKGVMLPTLITGTVGPVPNYENRPAQILQCFDAVGWLAAKAVVGCWRGYLYGATCKFVYGQAHSTATHCLLLQEIQTGFGLSCWYQLTRVVPDKIQDT